MEGALRGEGGAGRAVALSVDGTGATWERVA
jgi:hypothetical protein